jgi:uncharacterized membrane protein
MNTETAARCRAGFRWALLLLLFGALGHAQGEWRDVVQTITVAADGSTTFDTEITAFVGNGDFGEVFMCVEHGPSQLTLLPTSGVVRASSSGEAFTQPCTDGTELVVRLAQRTREARVRISYRLDNTLDLYRDVAQWYWNLLPRDRPTIVGYRATIDAPGPMAAPFEAYVMRYQNPERPTVTLAEDRSRLEIRFQRIPRGDGVEVRYLMDPALFTQRGSQLGMERLLREQAATSQVAWSDRLRTTPWLGLMPLALILYLAWGIFGAYQRVGREPRTDGMRYPFEPPRDLPPAAVTAMLQQNFSPTAMGPAWFATIMDLARRGLISFRGEGRNFIIVLDPGADASGLESFEREVLDYLKAAQLTRKRTGQPNELPLETLERYGVRHARPFLNRWGPHVRKWIEGFLGGPLTTPASEQATKQWTTRTFIGLALPFTLIFVTDGPAQFLMFASFGALALLLVTAHYALPAWRPEVAKEVAGWTGFKRTLSDFSRMKDAPPDFFNLWDRYYVYAAALGVAERYLRTLGRVAPTRTDTDQQRLASRAAWMGATNLRSLRDVSRSVQRLQGALAKAGASASSGGSSSGGGGGRGGGGGGGMR